MNYGELRTQFLGLLNRDDCTADLTDIFLAQGIARVQRQLRVPTMERLVALATDADGKATIPSDYLAMKDGIFVISTTPAYKLRKLELGDFLNKGICGLSEFYYRTPTQFWIKDNPGVTTEDFYISYYATLNALVEDEAEDPLLTAASDVFLYAGMTFGCDYFLDDRLSAMEGKYASIRDELNFQSTDQEASEGYTVVSAGTDTEF